MNEEEYDMACKNCERLRRKLSPMEDVGFTEKFKKREPVKLYMKSIGTRRGCEAVVVRLADVWRGAFGTKPSVLDLTILARTMAGLGWERTKRNGLTFFVMDYKEFKEVYDV